ncbi:MAG TPA: fibronectin type III domain-containing protein [Acidimicrobiia bacterium]|nr:fibronectin type III domain-containing protein [Acidimicrobiia bacterium]
MAGLANGIAVRKIGAIVAGLALVGAGSATNAAAATTQTSATAPAPASAGHKGGKLSPRLLALSRDPLMSATAPAQASALSLPPSGAGSLVRHTDGRLVTQIRMSDMSASAIRRLTANGAHVVSTSPDYRTVTADVAPGALGAIANDADVTYVGEVLAPLTGAATSVSAGSGTTATSAVCAPTISEGDSLMNVATARAAHGVDGSGETVGILSDSFNTAIGAPTTAATDVSTGDLPGVGNPCGRTTPVVVQSDFAGGGQTDEGRAMAQLVHDLAPGAHLAFATAFNGDLDFANQITALRAVNHANVIVDDISYFNEPFFQNGPIANAANAASQAGVPYFSSAGNANVIVGGKNVSSYEAPTFRAAACPSSVTALEPLLACHDFDPSSGTDNGDAVTVPAGAGFAVDLQWAQPWGGVTTDYDVFVVNSQGRVVAASAADNLGSQQPFEFAGFTNSTGSTQTVTIVIGKFAGAANPRLKFVLEGASRITGVEHNASTGTDLVGPTIFGHNGAGTVGSTAAIPFSDSTRSEDFSSRGPVTLFFSSTPSTTPLAAPKVLAKPDFAATDGVRTTFFAQLIGGVERFFGTSAAAPQAAAVGALLRQFDPGLLPAGIMATLHNTGRAVATNGTPSAVGGGYIDAAAALASVKPRPAAPRVTGAKSGNGRATVSWTAALTNPDFPVTGYVVTPLLGTVAQTPTTFNTAATSEVVTGLTNGATYTFKVTAFNANGSGPPSVAGGTTTIGAPGIPTAVTASPGNGQAVVKWTAPVSNGLTITGYTVTPLVGGVAQTPRVFNSAATTETVAGLTNGTTVTFEVAARTSFATGLVSKASPPIVVGAPGTPTAVTATAGVGLATVHWTAPATDNGAAITAYVVTPFVGGVGRPPRTFLSTATTQTITGLPSGTTFVFRVAATNSRGTGVNSSPSNAVTVT